MRKEIPIINAEGFERFWAQFPRKVGRLAAIREWNKLDVDAHFETEILAGVTRYIKNKPSYADWCHPRTWLSQGRWLDETFPLRAVQPVKRPLGSDAWDGQIASWMASCTHEPRCLSSTQHQDRSRVQ